MSYPKLKTERGKVKPAEAGIDFDASRPGTFLIEAGEEREAPTREDLSQIINSSPALARPQLRRELRQIIETFINKHSKQSVSQSASQPVLVRK